ncbi:MAG: excinuclease ABC subunit UvrB [Candidatus Marinimicrobia bacterium]|nr:excinuclease ABC subunit UvrB [Candidatus Neomarinimicrobiota bacterium]MDD5582568.1 excinuclease ABC subunit UvrB [Candidatus Neomarinimicrobiota bacterium]
MAKFKIKSSFKPTGDQPEAIQSLVDGLNRGEKFQTLLGITGSGKTFTMAKVIEEVQRPTLIISHNKTLAAQLYGEFKSFFPDNAVEYFISYYDYYQPEAYLPVTDTYIEKDSDINDEIEKLRLKATASLLSRQDVIVVASVSCIYGLGSPTEYKEQVIFLKKGETISRESLLKHLISIHYVRNDISFSRGTFRIRGEIMDIYPAYNDIPARLEFWGDELESITFFDPLTGKAQGSSDFLMIYPARHFITNEEIMKVAIQDIRQELSERLTDLRQMGKLVEAQRLEQRVNYDIEMMQELGYCSGIENYSRHLTRRKPGERPFTLMDFFPKDYLLFIDESHATIPQIRAMYNGDYSRKEVLVEYGFRLPSALDNRPMKFDEFEAMINQVIFVSATPADYEIEKTHGVFTEQIIRPTGLLDPEIEVRPTKNQIDDLIDEIKKRTAKKERVLITTLTKKMSENLAEFLKNVQVKTRYLHSEIDSLERISILRDLRLGEFDVLVGINLLREGLDLPEVSLVSILDADKQGFLRSERSLFQIAGRASRNVNGKVIFYADHISDAMKTVIDETNRRRKVQMDYNKAHNITPVTVYKTQDDVRMSTSIADYSHIREKQAKYAFKQDAAAMSKLDILKQIDDLTNEMNQAAENLEFELAAKLRDQILVLKRAL